MMRLTDLNQNYLLHGISSYNYLSSSVHYFWSNVEAIISKAVKEIMK